MVKNRRSLPERILNTLDNYGYPPAAGDQPPVIDGQNPTVFFCLQEDLNTTLVNSTLDAEGFGTCNISGKLVTCPIEIECKTSEADNCCEGKHKILFSFNSLITKTLPSDEDGTPYCCGGPIPDEYASQYGGYGDNTWFDAAESIHQL